MKSIRHYILLFSMLISACGEKFDAASDLATLALESEQTEYTTEMSIKDANNDGIYQVDEAITLDVQVTSNRSIAYQWQYSIECSSPLVSITGATSNILVVNATNARTCYYLRITIQYRGNAYINLLVADIVANSPVVTPAPTATPTATPRPTSTPTPTATATPRPTSTPTPTSTPRPTATPTPIVTGGGASADWNSRISGPGVVWYHNFDSEAEIKAFQWRPTTTNRSMRFVASGGPDGGSYMELWRPAGAYSSEDSTYWWRPLSPIRGANNGKGVDDPGASGTLAPQAFNNSLGAYSYAVASNQKPGWYGHPTYADSYFDGNEFYVQLRVMVDPRRTAPGNDLQGGKLFWLTTTNFTYTLQEIVTMGGSFNRLTNDVGSPNYHNMYQGYNYQGIADVATTANGERYLTQLGSEIPGTCSYYEYGNPYYNTSGCWAYSHGWDTLLYHVVPGREGVAETQLQVWAAHPNESQYTKIWDVRYPAHFDIENNSSGGIARNGWNAMVLAIYHNGDMGSTLATDIYHRFDQVIFSKNFIPAPGAASNSTPPPTVTPTPSIPPSPATPTPTVTPRPTATPTPTPVVSGPTPTPIPTLPAGSVPAYIQNMPSNSWYAVPNSRMDAVRPATLPAYSGEFSSIFAYSGGAYDTRRNRLLIFGGGHAAYSGNEVYGFSVGSGTWQRLTDPSTVVACGSSYCITDTDKPISVHTYDQLEYSPDTDSFFSAGGSVIGSGSATNRSWLLNLQNLVWTAGAIMPGTVESFYYYAALTDFDPVSRKIVYIGNTFNSAFNPSTRAWDSASGNGNPYRLSQTGALDPVARKFISVGGDGQFVYPLNATGNAGNSTSLGASGTGPTCRNPGFVYGGDSLGQLVAWCSGQQIYRLNVRSTTPQWTVVSPSGANPGTPYSEGTYGRFRYVPDYNVFVLVNSTSGSVYIYKP